MPQIDILIATAKERRRLPNLLANIRTALASDLETRVTLAMLGDYPELEDELSQAEKARIRMVKDAPLGSMGNAAALRCKEALDWGEWYYQIGDDDALLPWGLDHLYAATEGVSVVIGQAIVVTKDTHLDATAWKVGRKLAPGCVSGVCALMRFEDLERLPKPWYHVRSETADFELIAKMAGCYPYTVIANTVAVLSLEETPAISAHVAG